MTFPNPTPTSSLRDSMREDYLMLLNDTTFALPTNTVYHRRTGSTTDAETGNVVYTTEDYPRRATMSRYQPAEKEVLQSKVEFGPITFRYYVETPTESPPYGLNFLPSVMDQITHNGERYEVNGWELSSDEVEYLVHCQKVDWK